MGFFTGKNVLITGGAGLCGHAAVSRLITEGAYVRATTYRNGSRDLILNNSNMETIRYDFHNYKDCLQATKDIDIVLNFVAYLKGAKGQTENPSTLIRNNIVPNINIMDAACENRVEIFGFVGSSTCYPDVDYPVNENEGFKGEPHPSYTGVGWMKRYCEKVCMNLHEISNTKFAMIRTTAIYGPHDTFDPERSHVIPQLILKAHRQDNPFEVWGDGTQVRDFVFVDDVIDGLLTTVEKHPNADPINIATGKKTDIRKLVEVITQMYNYDPKFVYDTTKPTMIPTRLVDVTKAKKILNWSSKYELEIGLKETIQWYNKEVEK